MIAGREGDPTVEPHLANKVSQQVYGMCMNSNSARHHRHHTDLPSITMAAVLLPPSKS